MERYEYNSFLDINQYGISSPTCQDLGIPSDDDTFCSQRVIRNPSLFLEGLRYETGMKGVKRDPFSENCLIPMPTLNVFGQIEPSFIKKRNERERERVRCVNEGYSKLKQHLPVDTKDKRISKVETLRAAIEYIRYLQTLLNKEDYSEKKVIKRKRDEEDTSDESHGEDISLKGKDSDNAYSSDSSESDGNLQH